MHVSKFPLGIPNGCCVTKAKLNMFSWREGKFSPRALVRENPAGTKFAAENMIKFSWQSLTHLHLDKIAAILQTIFSDAFLVNENFYILIKISLGAE